MPMLKGKCEKCFEITLQKVGMCKWKQERLKKNEEKEKPKNKKNGLKKNEKIEMKDQSQENEFVTR